MTTAAKPLSKRTQSEIDDLIGVTNGNWRNGMEKLTYSGAFNGYPVSYTREYSGMKNEHGYLDIPTADDFIQATAWLETNGIKPSGAPAAVPVNQQQQNNNQQPPFGQENNGQQGGGWQCPAHGGQKIKPGYQGRGWECDISVRDQPPSWPHRVFPAPRGPIYYCTAKSQ